jgi:hypothetical protein
MIDFDNRATANIKHKWLTQFGMTYVTFELGFIARRAANAETARESGPFSWCFCPSR